MQAKPSIYEADQLEDEALALIMRPERKVQYTGKEKTFVTMEGTIFDQVHPNCLKFSDAGRLFAGDSRGRISVWDVSLRHNKIVVENHFKIQHKELDGDQINSIIVVPDWTNQLFVQSRDNCTRLIEYESSRGTRIKKRFFGALSKD